MKSGAWVFLRTCKTVIQDSDVLCGSSEEVCVFLVFGCGYIIDTGMSTFQHHRQMFREGITVVCALGARL